MNFVSGNSDSETSASGARVRPKTPKIDIINNLGKLDSKPIKQLHLIFFRFLWKKENRIKT